MISFFCCTFAPANKQQGTLADRLGNGLQNRVEQFDSARYLFSQSASVVLQPCGFFYPQISTDIIFYWIITDFILFFWHGNPQLFLKVTALLRDGNGLICLKAILKYRHGSLTLVKKSVLIYANLWTKNSVEKKTVNLRQQAVTTKCRGYINAEPKAVSLKKPCLSVPKSIHPCP